MAQMEIAVILFAYKRPRYLKKCLKSIKDAYRGDVAHHYYAFIDYSWMQDKIAKMIRNSEIFGRIIKREKRYGLNRNIIEGINEIFKTYDAVIVIEDDLVLDPISLTYLRIQLMKYGEDKKIGHINLEGNFPSSHGWAIWKDRWDKIDWDLISNEKNGDSWDIILRNNIVKLGWQTIGKNMVTHIGNIGEHYNPLSRFGIRKHFREWKEDYYRDKDLLMVKENFLTKLYRLFL